MKAFIITKVGYTAGIVGCTGEYFYATIIDGKKVHTMYFEGMYGAEQRVAESLKGRGLEAIYAPSMYGQLKRNDILNRYVLSEAKAVDWIRHNVGNRKQRISRVVTND